MKGARLTALGSMLPDAPFDDAALSSLLGLSVEEIGRYSMGRLRFGAPDGEGPARMAARLAPQVFEQSGREPSDVDLIVFTTNTADLMFPGSACLLQEAIGCATIGCLDVRAQCSGFIVALEVARRFVMAGSYRCVLVASGDVPTHVNRYDGIDPELACLTGDAAAVALVEPGAGPGELLSCVAQTDGGSHRQFWCEFPASRNLGRSGVARGERVTRAAYEAGLLYPVVDLEAMRETALARVPEVLDAAIAEAGLERVDALIVAHLDPGTEAALAERLGGKADKVVDSDIVYALGTSLALRLARARENGAVSAGETVALATAGAGSSWGCAVLRGLP